MGKCRSQKGQPHLYSSLQEKGVERESHAAKTTTPARLCAQFLPRVASSATTRLSVVDPDVAGPWAKWAWLTGTLELGALLLVVEQTRKVRWALAKARGIYTTANQKSGRALAGGRKAKTVQIWREPVWVLLLLVCSAACLG